MYQCIHIYVYKYIYRYLCIHVYIYIGKDGDDEHSSLVVKSLSAPTGPLFGRRDGGTGLRFEDDDEGEDHEYTSGIYGYIQSYEFVYIYR
jgi:hypothetical protein